MRELTPKTSLGFSAIDFAHDVLGITLFPWQKWLLIHALELRSEGGFRFRNVVVLVARQNGKSTLSQVLALWFMYVYGYDLVLGTAQDLDTAEEVWQGAVDLVTETDEDDRPVRPELFDLWSRTVMVNGKKTLELKTGARYKAKAASRRSARGLSGDLVLLDELREHQTWDAWGAITKTTMARDEAMVWALSNAGDDLSVVLTYLRKLAHAALGDPDGINADGSAAEMLDGQLDGEDLEADEDDLAIFEWSAVPGCDVWDREGWAQANPSAGHKISERTIASAVRTDPEPILRTEVLCQWVPRLDPIPPAFDSVVWERQGDPTVEQGSSPRFAVATAPDRAWAAIGAAWWRPDGGVQVTVVDYRPTATWVAARLEELGARPADVLTDMASRGLIEGAREPSQQVQAQAHNAFSDGLVAGTTWHDDLPELNTSQRASQWRALGDTRVLDRKGTADISPLIAGSLAAFGLVSAPSREFWGAMA